MARFEWRTLKIKVGEMSRGRALECSNAFYEYLQTVQGMADKTGIEADVQREVDYLFIAFAPASIIVNGDSLPAGKHTIDLGDDETLDITLPLMRSGFEALPVSLAAAWSQAAEEANGWLVNHFLGSLRMAMGSIPDLLPVNDSSSN